MRDPNSFIKDDIWCDDTFIIVKGHWRNIVGDCYMINIYGPQDSLAKAILWNRIDDFMHQHADNSGLIDLTLGGRLFTWMNKAGMKLSKLDRFLISEEVVEALPDVRVTAIDPGSVNDDDRDSRIKLLQEVGRLDTFKSFDLFQKARVIWNIKDGVWILDPSQIKEEFLNFFKEKFKDHDSNVDFLSFANSFGLCALDRGSLPHGSNSSFFTLLPKVSNPIFIKDFHPNSLIGVHYKIIAKILANWLAKVIDKIVSHKQSAFIVGHQILDGPLILSEIVECFGSKWRSWSRACLSSSRASVLVNDSPTSEFSIKRGLMQGDHLSPFLFIFVMKGFHNALSTTVSSGLRRGVKLVLLK
ncbi:hypothetical protein Tco_0180963 [Tanacetum coccineum]